MSTATPTIQLPPRTWRVPVILAVIGVVTFVVFGVLGRDEVATFRWSDLSDAIVLESTSVSPRVLGIVTLRVRSGPVPFATSALTNRHGRGPALLSLLETQRLDARA